MVWALQDAKAKFSEVVRRAQTEGPQRVTVRGAPAVVVIDEGELDALRAKAGVKPKLSFDEFLLAGDPWPDWFADLVNERSKDPGRDIDF